MEITYIEYDGTEHMVEIADDITAMEAALSQGIDGIEGDCGGSCNCATCHVVVAPEWVERVGPPSAMEAALLAGRPDLEEHSRLACQIRLTPELNGLVLRLPESQFV